LYVDQNNGVTRTSGGHRAAVRSDLLAPVN
jgi:hypothetical protein